MSVPANEGFSDNSGFQGQDATGEGQAPVAPVQNEPGINPAWNPLLEKLPSSLHGIVTPHLSDWDKNVQQMVQKVHSEYEPWKQLRDQQLDPQQLGQAWSAIQNLETDPYGFVQAVIQHYGLEQMLAEQGQQQPGANELEEGMPTEFDLSQNPDFQRMSGMTEQMAQLLLTQHQQQEDAQADAQVESDLQAAQQKFGNFDEDFVLQRVAMLGEDMDTAVQAYQNMVNGVLAQSRNPSAGAPIIMGSGGGTPSTATPVGSLQPQDRRALIAQTLRNAAANGG